MDRLFKKRILPAVTKATAVTIIPMMIFLFDVDTSKHAIMLSLQRYFSGELNKVR